MGLTEKEISQIKLRLPDYLWTEEELMEVKAKCLAHIDFGIENLEVTFS